MKNILFAAFVLMHSFVIIAQTDTQKTEATVSKSNIEGHIYFLASDELKGRATGSHEIDIAAAYLANTFRRYNVKPANKDSYYQEVLLEKVTSATTINANLNTISYEKLITLKGENMDFKGDAVFVNYGAEDDYKKKDVTGKLVIAKAGYEGNTGPMEAFGARNEKRKLALEKGAIGLIELSTIDDAMWGRFSNFFNSDKLGLKSTNEDKGVHLWLQDTNGTVTKALEGQKTIKASVSISGISNTPVMGKNVVGMVEGTDPKLKDEFVIYSAHYDHNGIGKPNAENDSIYNGARDNAVGTVTVLSAAENIAKYPTKRSALFILFTGEEKGLLGSKWYVEHPLIPLDKMVYCFNSDNGGYNDTSKATIIGLNRTTVSKHIIDAAAVFGLTAIDDPAPEQGLFDRSDNVHFAAKGIPAPTYSMGFTAFDEEINKYYHQTADNPDSLDYDYLFKFFKSYVLACRFIANDPVTPFWTKGDKYYSAGEKLYDKK